MKPHRDNRSFRWRDPPGPFTLLDEQQVGAYRQEGGFVLAGAFTGREIESLVAALDPLEEAAERALAEQDVEAPGIARPGEIVFAAHLVARSQVVRAFSRHPLLCRLVTELIGPDVRLYWDQLVYKKPHTGVEFPWHQDNGYTFVEPQQYLTCWIALTDATVHNGCPLIAPGQHREGTLAHRWTELGFRCFDEPPRSRPLELAAGSIAVFSSLTPHMTGPNMTDHVRKSYILQYAPDGAVMHPRDEPPVAAANPDWQYPVTRGGQRVPDAGAEA
jgi:ectoine hydroxylase-related dioxygenase (phytanoyl-CoA dioxygenase family)